MVKHPWWILALVGVAAFSSVSCGEDTNKAPLSNLTCIVCNSHPDIDGTACDSSDPEVLKQFELQCNDADEDGKNNAYMLKVYGELEDNGFEPKADSTSGWFGAKKDSGGSKNETNSTTAPIAATTTSSVAGGQAASDGENVKPAAGGATRKKREAEGESADSPAEDAASEAPVSDGAAAPAGDSAVGGTAGETNNTAGGSAELSPLMIPHVNFRSELQYNKAKNETKRIKDPPYDVCRKLRVETPDTTIEAGADGGDPARQMNGLTGDNARVIRMCGRMNQRYDSMTRCKDYRARGGSTTSCTCKPGEDGKACNGGRAVTASNVILGSLGIFYIVLF